MRRRHFETLRPLCPVCLAGGREVPLRLGRVLREEPGHIVEGVLLCGDDACQREYPILDGIPLLVANLREHVSDQLPAICQRSDLSEWLESLVGDCCGPGSAFEQRRQYLSSYAWDHYGDLDPQELAGEPSPGSMLRCLRAGRALAAPLPPGPILDAGCAVGRGTFALAEPSDELVLGVDLNFALLRLAADVLRTGVVRYPRRRVGVVYDRREFPASFAGADRVDFWACDATALPFADGTFSTAAAMNVLDSVTSPTGLLNSLARVLTVGGRALLTCPYDWSAATTPVEAWLGGHSQRSPTGGSAELVLRWLLNPASPGSPVRHLKLVAEQDRHPWHVRLHDRSTMSYQVHLLQAEKVSGTVIRLLPAPTRNNGF